MRIWYDEFKDHEAKGNLAATDDQFQWVSSAICRGLRDNQVVCGIVHFAELAGSSGEKSEEDKVINDNECLQTVVDHSHSSSRYPVGCVPSLDIVEPLSTKGDTVRYASKKPATLFTGTHTAIAPDYSEDTATNWTKTLYSSGGGTEAHLKRSAGKRGVRITKNGRFDARVAKFRVGAYKLLADAALAYDCAARVKGRRFKSNFNSWKDYLEEREREQEARQLVVDLEETLTTIKCKVDAAALKMMNAAKGKSRCQTPSG